MPEKCQFQDRWLNERQFFKWIARAGTSLNKANCDVCQKSFDVLNMGEAALHSHMCSKWHTTAMEFFDSLTIVTCGYDYVVRSLS